MRRFQLLVAAVVLVDTTFFAVLSPLLPGYAASLGLSKSAVGLLAGAFAAGVLVAALPSGLLASRLGLRTSLVLGLGLTAVNSVLFGLTNQWGLLVLTRFVAGVGSACSWTAAIGWLARTAPPERRGELIGFAMSAAVAGAFLGPALGAAAAWLGTGPAFATIAAACALLGARAATLGPSGTLAMVADPGGAAIGVWQADQHIGAGVVEEPGAMTWWEVNTRAFEDCRRFYGRCSAGTPRRSTPPASTT